MDIRARLHYMTLPIRIWKGKQNPILKHLTEFLKKSDTMDLWGAMGLVMNEHGFLSRTSILPGNASLAQNSGNNDQKP